MSRAVTARAPATVSNVACGFDVLGFAIDEPADEVTARIRPAAGVALVDVVGDAGRLPRDPDRNTASVAARALLERVRARHGVELTLRKGLPLASGLGGSAASAVAAVVAVNALIETPQPLAVLLECALEAERVACGSAHPDNAAPCLYGGFVLARSADPPDIIPLRVPDGLTCALLHPHLEIETKAARAILGEQIRLRDAVTQWANLGALVAGFYEGDFDIVRRALHDVVAEPKRAPLVPGFDAVKRAAMEAGALGCSLSGAGPSIFALCRNRDDAGAAMAAMAAAFRKATHLEADRYVSAINPRGAMLVEG